MDNGNSGLALLLSLIIEQGFIFEHIAQAAPHGATPMTNLSRADAHQQLLDCAKLGDCPGISRLLALGVDPKCRQSVALCIAAANGHIDCVKILLSASDPKAHGSAALLSAAENGHPECVALLIPVSDPAVESSDALLRAAERGHAECVSLLVPVSNAKANNSAPICRAVGGGTPNASSC